ncbi:MAG TPA: ornithine--oxo-acid transaminase [Fimbriimonadales bacterium]|nr:ornithine--oxo-acid transaminase [Fimbriimonadales bacterium]
MSETALAGLFDLIGEHGVCAAVQRLSDQEAMRLTEEFGTHNYHPLPVNVVRGKGIYAYDGSGKEYIDCIGSYSAVAHGHLDEGVIEAAKKQMGKITLTSRAVYTSELALFLQGICEFTGFEMACPMNTGAEAGETAIKLARKWGYTVKGIPEGKADVIAANDNFHGRTTTIVGFSSEPQYRAGFGPFTPGFRVVGFGDISQLEAAIGPNTAAVLMEPIQAEGGIIFPPDGYLAAVRELCARRNVLLIWDEIQTGFCRTGKRFAWQHEDAKPDMMCLGKALGGGIYPVAAVVGKRSVMEVFHPGDHGSTFGGNPLACVIALQAMWEMISGDFAGRSARMGARLAAGFRALRHEIIDEVRGRGLLVGIEVREGVDTEALTAAFLSEGILTKETRSRTFRFAPPLIISEGEVDEVVARTSRALDAVS